MSLDRIDQKAEGAGLTPQGTSKELNLVSLLNGTENAALPKIAELQNQPASANENVFPSLRTTPGLPITPAASYVLGCPTPMQ